MEDHRSGPARPSTFRRERAARAAPVSRPRSHGRRAASPTSTSPTRSRTVRYAALRNRAGSFELPDRDAVARQPPRSRPSRQQRGLDRRPTRLGPHRVPTFHLHVRGCPEGVGQGRHAQALPALCDRSRPAIRRQTSSSPSFPPSSSRPTGGQSTASSRRGNARNRSPTAGLVDHVDVLVLAVRARDAQQHRQPADRAEPALLGEGAPEDELVAEPVEVLGPAPAGPRSRTPRNYLPPRR